MIDAVQIPVGAGVAMLSINLAVAATQAVIRLGQEKSGERGHQTVSPIRYESPSK